MKFIRRKRFLILLVFGFILMGSLTIAGWSWSRARAAAPRQAPEGEAILQAQSLLPFQILIPAYLPDGFKRKSVEIQAELAGPQGEPMVKLIYTHPLGVTLTLTEWLRQEDEASSTSGGDMSVRRCTCLCNRNDQSVVDRWMIDSGSLRIMGETSDPQLLSSDHIRVILTTLAPAGGLLTYSSITDLPVATLPPAEEIPINAAGVQEVIQVVYSEGYSPAHFSVKKDIPVRLIFKQLGYVGCGNELVIQWGQQEIGRLILTGPDDSQILEFTPHESGDFLFHCPHYIYQGVMTVVD